MNILVVDDHPVIINSWTSILSMLINDCRIHSARDGRQAIEMVSSINPDVILLDVSMPELNGLEVAKYAIENTSAKVVIFTNIDGEGMVLNLIEIGVHGLLFKTALPEEMGHCIERVLDGEKYFCEPVKKIIDKHQVRLLVNDLPKVTFTPIETEILRLLVDGKTTKEICSILDFKESVINSYRDSFLKRTRTKNVAELIAYAFRNSLA